MYLSDLKMYLDFSIIGTKKISDLKSKSLEMLYYRRNLWNISDGEVKSRKFMNLKNKQAKFQS